MESVAQFSLWEQSTSSYECDCETGRSLACKFIAELTEKISNPNYDGMERHLLSDLLLRDSDIKATGIVVGFCYELIRQIEPAFI